VLDVETLVSGFGVPKNREMAHYANNKVHLYAVINKKRERGG